MRRPACHGSFALVVASALSTACGGEPARPPTGANGFVGDIDYQADGVEWRCVYAEDRAKCVTSKPLGPGLSSRVDADATRWCIGNAGRRDMRIVPRPVQTPTLAATGQGYLVAGRHCKEYEARDGAAAFLICVDRTLRMPAFDTPFGIAGAPEGLTLLVRSRRRDGRTEASYVATRLLPRPVAASELRDFCAF